MLWALSLSLAIGCGDSGDSGGGDGDESPNQPMTSGELSGGSFWYRCVGTTDALCPDGFRAETFPELFAVGGRFGISYNPSRPDGSGGSVVDVSSPELIRQEAGVLTMLQPGVAAVVVFRRGDVLDAVHLEAVNVERAAILMEGSDATRVEIPIGEKVSLRGEPRSAFDRPLAGALTYAWSLADPSLVSFGSLTDDNRVVVVGDELGVTQLKVAIGGLEVEVEVEVVEPPEPEGAQRTPIGGTGEGTDTAATDTDNDTGTGAAATDTDGDGSGSTAAGSDSGTGNTTGGME